MHVRLAERRPDSPDAQQSDCPNWDVHRLCEHVAVVRVVVADIVDDRLAACERLPVWGIVDGVGRPLLDILNPRTECDVAQQFCLGVVPTDCRAGKAEHLTRRCRGPFEHVFGSGGSHQLPCRVVKRGNHLLVLPRRPHAPERATDAIPVDTSLFRPECVRPALRFRVGIEFDSRPGLTLTRKRGVDRPFLALERLRIEYPHLCQRTERLPANLSLLSPEYHLPPVVHLGHPVIRVDEHDRAENIVNCYHLTFLL